ncbi:MAG: ferredoxin [Verrucomicrobia bacterium]|nr:ferredoxin [Verrucomicrobiota bacterium]
MQTSSEAEKQAALNAAPFMAAAARTAPKTRGMDNIRTVVIDDPSAKQRILEKMIEIAKRENRPSFERDANSIAASPALVVVGVERNPSGLNCGFCGYPTCEALEQAKGICAFNSIDLGIATGSAVAIAGNFHIDNRVMFSIGRACLDLKFFGENVKQALGIPLSVTGKNPFFDRKS